MADVHDLHAWTITSGVNVVSAHVVLALARRPSAALDYRRLPGRLRHRALDIPARDLRPPPAGRRHSHA